MGIFQQSHKKTKAMPSICSLSTLLALQEASHIALTQIMLFSSKASNFLAFFGHFSFIILEKWHLTFFKIHLFLTETYLVLVPIAGNYQKMNSSLNYLVGSIKKGIRKDIKRIIYLFRCDRMIKPLLSWFVRLQHFSFFLDFL